jgi:hypothetical protein
MQIPFNFFLCTPLAPPPPQGGAPHTLGTTGLGYLYGTHYSQSGPSSMQADYPLFVATNKSHSKATICPMCANSSGTNFPR